MYQEVLPQHHCKFAQDCFVVYGEGDLSNPSHGQPANKQTDSQSKPASQKTRKPANVQPTRTTQAANSVEYSTTCLFLHGIIYKLTEMVGAAQFCTTIMLDSYKYVRMIYNTSLYKNR